MKKSRDDFSERTKLRIAKRAGWLCSFPTCRSATVGATSDREGEINIGTAAHICAAALGGPRYDEEMSAVDRASVKNGIWMCRDHGKAIDSSDSLFTVERLLAWKRQAENESWQRVLGGVAGWSIVDGDGQLTARIRTAAEADLRVFRQSAKWPSSSVELTLQVEGFGAPVTTRALAEAATSLDDLILVAPPGMGKTTAMFQIAESILASASRTPVVVPLGDWATEGATVLDSILSRPAFLGISEFDFRRVAARPGVVLLLDGWNELDGHARARARVQVSALKAELPEMGLVLSTRRQALDVPFGGTRISLLPLSERQQVEIANVMRGDDGAKLVDQAWRTAGVRELVTIPLYLTALLSLPEGAPFPTTKEEVLRRFVAAHEGEASTAEALRAVTQGFHQNYLDGLAEIATRLASTAITESNARRSIVKTEAGLVANEQIAIRSQPGWILDVFVSKHLLMHAGDTPGYSFPHQQFQEWYASHSVEQRIVAQIAEPRSRESLKTEVFNFPAWEEPILFAVERLARGDTVSRLACATAIVAAFEVDPILAAEMIFRSTDEVWAQIASNIQGLVERWHVSGRVDRALRFMLTSGRSEFLDVVWPLISSDDQISLSALRNCRRFRPSILGPDAEQRIKALPSHARRVLLHEIASHSDIDGLNLASSVAREEPDPEVQAYVVEAFAFRRADRHAAEVLQNAGDKTFDLVAPSGLVDDLDDECVRMGLAAARDRQTRKQASPHDRLRAIVYAKGDEDRGPELIDIISTMEIGEFQDNGVDLIHLTRTRYRWAVEQGLLARVRMGRRLFYRADDILVAAGLALEEEVLLKRALDNAAHHDPLAEAATSVLGPMSVGRLVDRLLDCGMRLRVDGAYDHAEGETFHGLQTRLAHSSGASLVGAVLARSAQADSHQMATLADLLSRHPDGEGDRGRAFDAASEAAIQGLVQEWGNRMLCSGNARRRDTASIATLASRAPSVQLLPILKLLLVDNLLRYSHFRAQAKAAAWRPGEASNEATTPLTGEYQRAFLAIDSPETAALMREYLRDEHFGVLAAHVLAEQWRRANQPRKDKRFSTGIDFSSVKDRRAARVANPDETSVEAEAIFAAIEPLIAEGATVEQKGLAVQLGVVASALPHGRRDATIQRLIALSSWRSRSSLLLSLVLSGVAVDVEAVQRGVYDLYEAAKTETWLLTQSEGYELKVWLRLLPFVDHPSRAMALLRSLPPKERNPHFLSETVGAFAQAPSEEAAEILFEIAEEDSAFYQDYRWRQAVFGLNTESSANRLVNLVAAGALRSQGPDAWDLADHVGRLLQSRPAIRKRVYELLKNGPDTDGLVQLARAVAVNPDADGLLLLIRFEKELNRSFLSGRTIEGIVTKHIPSDNWEGTYEVVPIPSGDLRQRLLLATTDGGPTDAAARCLNAIDAIRDEYGEPESEPRHPDLASGRPWPILRPGPDEVRH